MTPNTQIPIPHAKERNVSLDLLRVLAIFLVVWQHTNEFYYIGTGSSLVKEAAPTVGIIDSYARCCIGLFVMISGYLLLPMKTTTGQFFRRRLTRVAVPWAFWCVAYAAYFVFQRGDTIGQMLVNIAHIPVNFGTEVGHLYYVYMIVGVYLAIPVISPWLRSCSKRELQFYLALWGITTLLPYLHLQWPGLWGECSWNPTPTLYYFTGFGGYLVLGHYLRRYGLPGRWLAWALLVVGYAVSAGVFCLQAPHVEDVARAEVPWNFCCLNVAMMALGTFSLVMRARVKAGGRLARLAIDVSVCSFAIYLCHIMLLNAFHSIIDPLSLPLVAKVPLIAIPTLVASWLAARLLALLPKAKWWLGVD